MSVISSEVYGVVVFMAVATTLVTPLLLKIASGHRFWCRLSSSTPRVLYATQLLFVFSIDPRNSSIWRFSSEAIRFLHQMRGLVTRIRTLVLSVSYFEEIHEQ